MNSTSHAIARLASCGLTIASVRAMGLANAFALIRNRRAKREFKRSFDCLYRHADPIAGVRRIDLRKVRFAYLILHPNELFGQTRPAALIAAAERMLSSMEDASPTLQTDVAQYLAQLRVYGETAHTNNLRRVLQIAYRTRALFAGHERSAMRSLNESIANIERILSE